MPPVPKKAATVRGAPTRPVSAGITSAKRAIAKTSQAAAVKPLQKIMEVEALVDEVVEDVSNAETANAVERQTHEIELIPLEKNEKPMQQLDGQKDEGINQRRTSEADSHRRINRLDSEVQIEEILTRVFEDITTMPKPEPLKQIPPAKTRFPLKKAPPAPKVPTPKVQRKVESKIDPFPQPTSKPPLPTRTPIPKKAPLNGVKATPKPSTSPAVGHKTAVKPAVETVVPTKPAPAPAVEKKPAVPRKPVVTKPMSTLPKRTTPAVRTPVAM